MAGVSRAGPRPRAAEATYLPGGRPPTARRVGAQEDEGRSSYLGCRVLGTLPPPAQGSCIYPHRNQGERKIQFLFGVRGAGHPAASRAGDRLRLHIKKAPSQWQRAAT
jgi:hypothetical protein